jgi:hypothetical protein
VSSKPSLGRTVLAALCTLPTQPECLKPISLGRAEDTPASRRMNAAPSMIPKRPLGSGKAAHKPPAPVLLPRPQVSTPSRDSSPP